MRKRKLLEELNAAHNATDYWRGLFVSYVSKNEKLTEQLTKCQIEIAILNERLKKESSCGQEDQEKD